MSDTEDSIEIDFYSDDENIINFFGCIKKIKNESNFFYGIVDKNNKKFFPINLNDQLKKENINIHIKAKLLKVDNAYNWGETIEIISFNVFDCIEKENNYYLFSNNNISDVLLKNFSENKDLFVKNNKNEIDKVIIIYKELIILIEKLIKEIKDIKSLLIFSNSSKNFKLCYQNYKHILKIFFYNLKRLISKCNLFNFKYICLKNDNTSNITKYCKPNNFYSINENDLKFIYSIPGINHIYHVCCKKNILSLTKTKGCKTKINTFQIIPELSILNNKINKETFKSHLDSIIDYKNNKNTNILEFINFIQLEIKDINNMNNNC